jgi:hypothetical protein
MRKIYSDSFIHIERSDRIIEGLGFDSNEKLSAYNIKKPTGIFPVENMKKENGARSNVEQPADLPPPAATPEP